jgi:hypothetical protein
MKMNRSELKALIKECLVEVLAEGLGDITGQINESRAQRSRPQVSQQARKPLVRAAAERPRSPQVPDAVRTMQKIAPNLASVFADPATLANASKMIIGEQAVQQAAGAPGQAEVGLYEQVMDQVDDLTQVGEFEEGAGGHWAALAFAGAGSPKNSGDDDT